MNINIAKSVMSLIVITFCVAAFSFLVWVLPGFFYKDNLVMKTTAKPLTPLQLTGRDVYMAQGCHVCHTQMVRNLEPERIRYGRSNKMEDDVYEFTFLWGSARIGPDLTNIGLKYTNEWHVEHLTNPQALVPESIMPKYPWLFEQAANSEDVGKKMTVLQTLGVPYSDADIALAPALVKGKTKGEALVAYLMSLGVDTKDGKGDIK